MVIAQNIKINLLSKALNAAIKAGYDIMEVYSRKNDTSDGFTTPVLRANRMAHERIKAELGDTRIPILSEEGREMRYEERQNWELFWLVDPLDGTIEFIKGNNEFTVNIALMSERKCIVSVMYVPYLQKVYYALKGEGAFVLDNMPPSLDTTYSFNAIVSHARQLPLENSSEGIHVAISRSHQNAESARIIDDLKGIYGNVSVCEQGSSFKFCMLAEGSVDYYPRTTQTFEWDTAASELILEESGGITRNMHSRTPLEYNKEDLHNPYFECYSRRGKKIFDI